MTSEPTKIDSDPQIVDVEHPEPKIIGSDVEQAEDAIATDQEVAAEATDPKVAAEAGDAADVAEVELEDQQAPGQTRVLDAIAEKVADRAEPEEGQP
jgi:hypothetical protein